MSNGMESGMDGYKRSSFVGLPAEAFPLTLTAFGVTSKKQLWQITVDGPGVVEIPPLAAQHGEQVHIEVHYADGTCGVY